MRDKTACGASKSRYRTHASGQKTIDIFFGASDQSKNTDLKNRIWETTVKILIDKEVTWMKQGFFVLIRQINIGKKTLKEITINNKLFLQRT